MDNNILSPYLLVLLIAWLGAHVVKFIFAHRKNSGSSFIANLFTSGGMPSSHTTTVVALTTLIAGRDGVGSGLFGLAALFSLIVMYDAMKVRRSSGEQGLAIKALISEQNSKVKVPRAAQGHTPVEVVFGAIFGVVLGIIVYLLTK